MKSIKVYFLIFTALTIATSSLFNAYPAEAARAEDWKDGNIISDDIFTNKSAMSVQDIQRFLDERINCDVNGTKISELGGGTRAQYGASRGNPAPFTCLNTYHEVPKTTPGPYIPANNYGGKPIPAGAKSAAQIIWDAAQRHNINPQVILVKIATESAGPLTSDQWPFLNQYTYAMGAHCPDSGPGGSANCDINYAGFSIQVSEGTALMRSYLDNMSQPWWPYRKPFTNNNILWNVVESGCGAGNVYIESKATAALYTYTPYQPNRAALNNLYGTGDSCSAYGNRNFWRVFVDWFGSSQNTTPFFSHSNRVFMKGSGNTYYDVPNQTLLDMYGIKYAYDNKINYVDKSYTNGMVNKGNLPWVARFDDSNDIFIMSKQGLHKFTSEQAFFNYGFKFGEEALIPSSIKSKYKIAGEVHPIATQTDWKKIHLIEDGRKREFSDSYTFNNSGNPKYVKRPHTTLPPEFLASLPSGSPVIADGRVVKDPTTGQLSINIDGSLQAIDPSLQRHVNIKPDFSPNPAIFKLIPLSGKPGIASQYLKNESGESFLLDASNKIKLNPNDLTKVKLTNLQDVSSSFLDRYTTRQFPQVLRHSTKPEVFYINTDNQLYHVYNEKALFTLNFAHKDVLQLKTPIENIFNMSNLPYFTTGNLVRESNSPMVHVISSQRTKSHISTEPLLFSLGKSHSDVSVVAPGSLSSYTTTGKSLTSLISSGQDRYFVSNSCAYKITESESSNLQLNDTSFSTIPNINALGIKMNCGSFGNLIRAEGRSEVYQINNSKKQWVINESAFNKNKFRWSDVRVLPKEIVNQIPTGENLK